MVAGVVLQAEIAIAPIKESANSFINALVLINALNDLFAKNMMEDIKVTKNN